MSSNNKVSELMLTNIFHKTVETSKPVQASLYQQAENYGKSKVIKSAWQSFGLAVFAGAFIALAFVFFITVTTGNDGSSWGVVRLVGGLAFSLGLMLVVICGGELFIVGGGVFVGLGYWLIEKSGQAVQTPLAISVPQLETSGQIHQLSISDQIQQLPTFGVLNKMPKSIQKLCVRDLMDTNPLTITADLSVYAGLTRLADNDCRSAPVLDEQKRLLGFISQQDLLCSLWSEEFARGVSYKVGDLMQKEVMTLSPQDSVAELIELMVVDRNKLFPVNEHGILTGNTFKSYEERLRSASADKPSVFPVLDKGLLCGVITRDAIAKKVSDIYKV